MAEGGKEAGRGDDAVVAAITVRGLQQPIRDLERLLGKKTLEIEILRTPLRLCGQKTVVARALAFWGGYPMKAIPDTLHVSRSNLLEQVNWNRPVRAPYRKADDAWRLPMIRRPADDRPTYGYRRIGVLLNRQATALANRRPTINASHRIMPQNGLLLARHTDTGLTATVT